MPDTDYAYQMPRLLLIAVLLIQPFLAQAAIAGVPCEHTSSAHVSESGAAMHHGTQHSEQHSETNSNGERSLCDCVCDIAGHCSGTAVGSIARAAGTDFSLRSDRPATATDATASGFRTHPYRPPSTSA